MVGSLPYRNHDFFDILVEKEKNKMISLISQRLYKYSLTMMCSIQKKMNLSSKANQYYFAYGGNLTPERFKSLNMKFKQVGVGSLKDFRLSFSLPCEYKNKGYANILSEDGSIVWGTVYKINFESLLLLDVLEWVPFGFYKRNQSFNSPRQVGNKRGLDLPSMPS